MGYKDPLKQKQFQANRYQENKDKCRQNLKDRRIKLAKWMLALKQDKKCLYCPENHPACLDFHHRKGTIKVSEIGTMVSFAWSKEKILLEIEKCDLLCSNCHRKLHWQENLKKLRVYQDTIGM
jgi:hypothetical protein